MSLETCALAFVGSLQTVSVHTEQMRMIRMIHMYEYMQY